MEAIRAAVGPDVTLLGCGAPFGSMLGLVEAMRIGADVSGDWEPKFNGIGLFIKDEPSFPCTRNSIRNILTRANLHNHWWINDPDCLLLRPETNLSLAEVRSLATAISITGGSLLVSDDMPKLPIERQRIAEVLLPVIGERAGVMDWFDSEFPEKLRLDMLNETGEWHILTRFNWEENPVDVLIDLSDFQLSEGNYWVKEFWTGKTAITSPDQPVLFKQVPSHSCLVLTVRKKIENQPCYLGSDLHISQGMEVASWKVAQDSVELTLRLPRKTSGKVTLTLPGSSHMVVVDDKVVETECDPMGIISIPVLVDGFANIKISWQVESQ
jgi:alpha-galactosidase